ncbi:DUF317 domain-containing protein [Streptomyces sp. NPDC002643]
MRFLPHDAADEVLVSPPCLAGGGDPRWITAALHQADGWRYDHMPLSPYVHLIRRDQQAELSLYPDPDEPWWTILHAATGEHPAWYARFTARVPVEILAVFTDTLTAPTQVPASDPFEILYAADWLEHSDLTASSPDGLLRVERADHGPWPGSWFITTTLPNDSDTVIWRAHLGGDTPLPLVSALTRALTEVTPLRRDPAAIPLFVRPHLQTVSAPPHSDTGLDPLEQRVQDLAARRARPAPSVPPHRSEPPTRRTR